MAEFRCYLLDRNRKVMAVDIVRALALPRAVTKGILAAAARQAAAFELWRGDLCVYTHEAASAAAAAQRPAAPIADRRNAADR